MKILIFLAALFLTGCVTTTPNNSVSAEKLVTVEHDKFNNLTELKMPLMLSRKGFTDPFPVSLAYRAALSGSDIKKLEH